MNRKGPDPKKAVSCVLIFMIGMILLTVPTAFLLLHLIEVSAFAGGVALLVLMMIVFAAIVYVVTSSNDWDELE